MRQRITAGLDSNLGIKSTFFNGLKQELTSFFKNHPLCGGGIVLLIVGFLLLGDFFIWNLIPAKPFTKGKQLVKIHYGASLRETSSILEKQGIIRSRLVFEVYGRLTLGRQSIKSGSYLLSPGMSVRRVAKILEEGKSQLVRVTIPEGLTTLEVADLLAAKGVVDRDRFLNLLQDVGLLQRALTGFPVVSGAEGYLFPDTYDFRLGVAEREVITTMLRRFGQVFTSNFNGVDPAQSRRIVIVASLVEKEAKKAAERPVIAGVFYNRLRQKFPLQSCATVQYSLGAHKERLNYQDLKVESPYNTYLHNGLPPGPIANPGLASLKAAVYPAQVKYFYFVAQADGSHVFSNTYQQHLNAQKKIKRSYWFK